MASTLLVNGQVTESPSGDPVVGVTVELFGGDGSGVVDSDVTDASGNYSVSHTEPSATGESFHAIAEADPPHLAEGTSASVLHGSVTVTRDITMAYTNSNPTCTAASSPRTFEEDTGSYTGDFTFADADGDVVSVDKVSGASWGTLAAVGASTGRWTWNSGSPSPGDYVFEYRVIDSEGGVSTTRAVEVTITAGNAAPVLTNPGAKSYANKSGNQTFQLAATDADSDPLAYSKQSGPSWVTVSSSGLVTVNTNSATRGVHNITYKVSDGNGGTDTEASTITITNNVPVLTNPGNQQYSTNSGDKTLQLSATDADGDTKTYSKTSGAAWGTVTSGGLITFAIGATVAGVYSFTFQVSDGQGGTDSESFDVVLVDPVPAPFFQMQG